MEVTQRRKEGRKRKRWKKSPAGDAPSRRELRRRCAPTMVTHDLPSSLQTDILQIVVAAFLVLLQRTALLVAPAAVVALVRLPHCGKNESMGSDPRLASAIHRAHTSATNNSCDGKTPKKGYSSPRPFSQPRFPPRTRLLPPAGCFVPSVFHTSAASAEGKGGGLGGKANKQMLRGGKYQPAESHPSTARTSLSPMGKKLLRPLAHGTNCCLRKNELPQWPNSSPSCRETHYVAQRSSFIEKSLPKLLREGWKIH